MEATADTQPTDHGTVLDQLTLARCRQLPSEVADWGPPGPVRAALMRDTREQLEHLELCEWTRRYFEAIRLATEDDYRQALVTTEHGCLLCGIHFKGGDPSEPFVEIVAWTFPDMHLAEGIRHAMDRFAAFKPRWARVLTNSDCDLLGCLSKCGFEIEGDQVISAARLGALAQSPQHPLEQQIRLEDIPVCEIARATEFVREAYAQHLQKNPSVDGLVFPASREELEECAKDGRLAHWKFQDQVLGLIAVARRCMFGLDGFLAIELVVKPDVGTRGTAAAAQAKLARELATMNPGLVYFGTIACSNHASRRTARRVGRAEIAEWFFVSRPRD